MKKVLIVDDVKWDVEAIIDRLKYEGYEWIYAASCDEALSVMKTEGENIRIVVVDSYLPIGDKSTFLEKQFKSNKTMGLQLAKYISKQFSKISIVGYSQLNEEEIISEFKKNGFNYISKLDNDSYEKLFEFIEKEFNLENPSKISPNVFIVHGHDELTLLELKNYLQNTLKIGEPIILKEKPNHTKTILEKFEKYASKIDLVFVIMTPDDLITVAKSGDSYSQARPNVLFELGYFLGRLKRTSGKVIILVKSKVNILSDLSGIIYIDISNGIVANGELIRKEIEDVC